jgi:hypothetical protein
MDDVWGGGVYGVTNAPGCSGDDVADVVEDAAAFARPPRRIVERCRLDVGRGVRRKGSEYLDLPPSRAKALSEHRHDCLRAA